MYKLMGKEINTILGAQTILIWTYVTVFLQMTAAITGISDYNKDLVQKYQKEMKLRKKYHNELVELKGT